MNRYLKRTSALALVCGLASVAWAQAPLYSWHDAEGKRHFSDQPPPPEAVIELEIDLDDLPALTPMQPPGESPYRPLTPPVPAEPASPDIVQAPDCVSIERRLTYIQQRLRAGYREPEGNRLRAERRRLQEYHRRECD
ncbi:DUF4124 domain-containing protein [Litchfieldella rifensis]|uniref:DUF4124 domain-containing protein n=1 Tax=Litchfieldella rifensis TaxID=762643 RepID=A0ABV7LWB4_9GAMM